MLEGHPHSTWQGLQYAPCYSPKHHCHTSPTRYPPHAVTGSADSSEKLTLCRTPSVIDSSVTGNEVMGYGNQFSEWRNGSSWNRTGCLRKSDRGNRQIISCKSVGRYCEGDRRERHWSVETGGELVMVAWITGCW